MNRFMDNDTIVIEINNINNKSICKPVKDIAIVNENSIFLYI